MTHCPLCGAENQPDAPQCTNCGTQLLVAPEVDGDTAAAPLADTADNSMQPDRPATDDDVQPEGAATGDDVQPGAPATDDDVQPEGAATGDDVPDEARDDVADDETADSGEAVLRSGELLRSRRYMILRCTSAGDLTNEYVAADRAHRLCPACGGCASPVGSEACTECQQSFGDGRPDHPEVVVLEAFAPSTLRWADVMENAPVEHDGLVPVLGCFEHTPYGHVPRHYAVLGRLEGRSLSAITPPLGPRQVVTWGSDLAESMSALHEAGVVHGALRTSSVRVVGDRVLLTGFERARPIRRARLEGDEPAAENDAGDERTNDDVRGDIVALGALLQSLLPRRGAPAEVTELIARAIGVVPGRTFADMRGFAQALQLQAEQMGEDAPAGSLRSGSASDVGQVRQLNEDSLVTIETQLWQVSKPSSLGLYAIADGIGGHDSGEVASGIAVRELATAVLANLSPPEAGEPFFDAQSCESLLVASCRAAGRAVYEARSASGSDMGATLVAAIVHDGEVFLAHAGDSRAYRVNEAGIVPLTTDHTLVQQWVDQGQLSPDEARTHPRRNLIYRQVGEGPDVAFDVNRALLTHGDWLLLCSDGLSGMVKDAEILSVFSSGLDPQAVCDELVLRANQAGGDDNISVVAATFRRVD